MFSDVLFWCGTTREGIRRSELCQERTSRQKAEKDLIEARAEVEKLTQRLMREIADHLAAKQTVEEWKVDITNLKSRATAMRLPTHKCRVCGALWQIQRKQDTLEMEDAWNLCSPVAGQCCDNVFMGEQMVPAEVTDVLKALFQQKGGAS